MPVSRISQAFQNAESENRAALVLYIMAGDPNIDATLSILDALAQGGADVIELGFPFSDPMADGPSIQAAAIRSLKNKTTLVKCLEIAKKFRVKNDKTALILMGYLNPIETYGYDKFAKDAGASGVDGMIVVDAPPEEDTELRAALKADDIALIRLVTPTTDEARLKRVVEDVSGFVYYVSVAGVTGVKAIDASAIKDKVAQVKAAANLPVAIGFGIRNQEAANQTAQIGDGIVIGAALVDIIHNANQNGEDYILLAKNFAASMKAAAIKN